MNPILPGATVGVLGSGQLGRMFAIAARRLGYRVHVLSPDDDTPTGQVADLEIQAYYSDLERVAQFARAVDVVTFEFENVPADTIAVVDRFVPVRPAGHVLHITQNRLREKRFLQQAGLPVTPFREVRSLPELQTAVGELGYPAILKTSSWGYDGKGQRSLKQAADLESAWLALQTTDAILEQFVSFQCELSVVAARALDGTFVAYDPIRNDHSRHILDLSSTPAELPPNVSHQAIDMARTILEKLKVVGVLCVEFFLDQHDRLLVNELAPRPHNSGHLTIDACVTCQFEQQLRAICGLPLGDVTRFRPAAMANLLGDLWEAGEPDWPAVCALSDVKLHLYGKREARVGRKMGHLTVLASSPAEARQRVLQARQALSRVPLSDPRHADHGK